MFQKIKAKMKEIRKKNILTKRNGVIAGIVVIALAIVSIVAVFQKDEKINKKGQSIESPELARAMTYAQVADGDEATNSQYVNFDAFFLRDLNGDNIAEGVRGTCKEIGTQDTLYMELSVNGSGSFRNGKITINSDNFYFETAIPKDLQVKENAIGINTKEIFLNEVGVGTQKMLSGTVKSGDYRYSNTKTSAIGLDTSKYSKINSITLTGTHVADDGTEVEVSKTVNFNIDWYGTTGAELPRFLRYNYDFDYKNQARDITSIVDEVNNEVNLEFEVLTKETKNLLNISRAEIEAQIPQINGYDPVRVEVTGKNVTYDYDEVTHKLVARRDAVINENGKVIENAYTDIYDNSSNLEKYNKFNLKITYPIEVYKEMGSDTIEIRLPVNAYYYGFNNENTEFTNPYKSSPARDTIVVTFRRLGGNASRFDAYVGKYVYEPNYRYIVSKNKPLKIYNELSELEVDDTYIVRWVGLVGSNEYSKMMMKETSSDVFIKSDSSEESMENVTKYKGIYFSNPSGMLGEEGEIKVYDDETGDLLVTFNKNNWNRYSELNPYKYEVPVKRIRVETSKVNKNSSLSVYNVKELDDEYITNNYTREEFDNFSYIKTNLSGYMGESGTPSTDTHRAYYEAPVSVANVSVEQTAMSTQETEKNYKITIDTKTNSNSNQEKWSNGSFLLKLPEEIIDIELNEVSVNNSRVTITGYETYEENGSRFIKILTENETPESYQIVIDSNVTPDPRIATVSKPIELYAVNENCENYYYSANDIYDVNGNSNITEKVNKTSVTINFTSPNSLLTNQVGSNYDAKGSVVVAPQVALVGKNQRRATVEVEVKNNYSSTISEIQLLGKVPSEGNTYAVSGSELGSNFTSNMTTSGIQVPEVLREYAIVYYSEKNNVNKDINDTNNGWITAPTDWTKVKSYLIVLNNYTMPKDAVHKFTYEIEIPAGLNYNQVAYSHHGVYFSLDTPEGKYKTQVEPNKLGFMIAKEFNVEVTKYQKDTNKLVPGATYILTEDGAEDGRTRTTNNNGKFAIDKVLAEKTYILREVKSPKQYELNNNEIKFTTRVNDRGELEANLVYGTLRNGSNLVVNNTENGYVLSIEVEDEVRPNLKITKTERGSETKLQGIKFKVTGRGFERGRVLTTNINGEVSLVGLYVNEEYTLEETKAEGYYLASPLKFKIVNNSGTYTVEVIEGTAPTNIIETIEEIPTINFKYENDKIPTYDLELSKIKKLTKVETSKTEGEIGENAKEVTYLSGAKFRLYKGEKELGEYVSDENGRITITGLYQYEADRDIDQTYILKEILAPEGYAKVKDITFKVQNIDGSLQFIEDVQNGQAQKTYIVEGNTVKVTIEDNPSFKLIKKDGETAELLAGIKFAIYNIDDGQVPAVNSKGEILGTKEIINGREYYTVTTDANGEITADLREGLYKAVEVEAPEKYDISDSIYYFGIGVSREGKKVISAEWGKSIGSSEGDLISTDPKKDEIVSVVETLDGGYIVGGYFQSSRIDLGNGIILNNNGNQDGMIIKYGANGEVEWEKVIGGSENDTITSVVETSDGGYIAGGDFKSNTIDLGNGIILNKSNRLGDRYGDGMIIKYDANGEIKWTKTISGDYDEHISSVIVTEDEGYIIGGYFSSYTLDLGNGVILNRKSKFDYYTDGMIIKYRANGEVEWGKAIGGTKANSINSVIETEDGRYIAGGNFGSETIDLGNGVILNNNGNRDGMVIKYDTNGKVEWGKVIGGSYSDYITSVAETSDGGCIVGGYFGSKSIDLGNGVILNNNGSDDGMIIKYNANGEVEWGKAIGGRGHDEITSVAETSDGGYIAGGYFKSTTIDLGNGVILNNGNYDGMIIKYGVDGEVEWSKAIGGAINDYINSVEETSDGGYITGGYFGSESIDLGNGVILNNNGSYDGMIFKIKEEEIPEAVIKSEKVICGEGNDNIGSIVETSDGGYIVGGSFGGESIDLGNGVTLNGNGEMDGMLIKYRVNGEVEWSRVVGGSDVDYITSVAKTRDGGYIVVGDFDSRSIDLGNGVILNNNGSGHDDGNGMIIKYDAKGEVKWGKAIEGASKDFIYSVAETLDGGYVVGGYFQSERLDLGNGVILNNDKRGGMIIKFDSQGEGKYGKTIGSSINSVAGTSDGGYIAGGDFYGSIDLGNGVILNNNGSQDGMLIKYGAGGEVEWGKVIGGSSEDKITSVAETSDGGYIAGGYFISSSIDLGNGVILNNNGSQDGMIIKYNANGEVEWGKAIGGSSSDYINSVTTTGDGGYIVGGDFQSESINLGNGKILNNNAGRDGMIIKYGVSGEVEWGKNIEESKGNIIYSVAETEDGQYIAVGHVKLDTRDMGIGRPVDRNNDGIIVKVNLEMGIPDIQEITALNNRKEFKITTEVKKIDGIAGGVITGGTENVKYGDNSTKEIKMMPDENYEIISITINDKEYEYEKLSDGTYVMPLFENVQEDKHVVVTYALKSKKIVINKVDSATNEKIIEVEFKLEQIMSDNSLGKIINIKTNSKGQAITQIPFGRYRLIEVNAPDGYEKLEKPVIIEFKEDGKNVVENENTVNVEVSDKDEFIVENKKLAEVHVHHYLKDRDGNLTTTKLAEDDLIRGKVGESYTSLPHLDLEQYELEKDENGNAITPENAVGIYTEEEQEVIYYYVERQIPLIVHHYIEGTNIKVPLADGSEAEDVTGLGYNGDNYTTNAIPDEQLDGEYELVGIPENSEGTYSGGQVIVNYYYKKAERLISLVKFGEDGETPLKGAKFEIKLRNELEGKVYTTNAQGKIELMLEAGEYEVTEIEAPEGYVLPENPTTNITITKDMVEKNLEILNDKAKGIVIVHHYIEGTTTPITLADGTVAQDEIKTGYIGDIYVTNPREDISEGYRYIRSEGERSGTYIAGTIEVTYYYDIKEVSATIIKTDEEGNTLQGVRFYLVNKVTGVGEYFVTNSEGKIEFEKVPGDYVLTEVETIDGYRLNDEPIDVKLEQNKENIIRVENKKINYFDLEINKLDKESLSSLSGVEFLLKYDETEESYITDDNGKIILRGLEDEEVYTLKEVKPLQGYVENTEEKQFIVHYVDGRYEIEMLNGSFENVNIADRVISCDVYNEPSLKILKQDKNGNLLPNAKFTITDSEGNEVAGVVENIDGVDHRVVTSDENGVISANLIPGIYTITEVQAPEGYKLPENESDRIHTVEILPAGDSVSAHSTGNETIEKENVVSMTTQDMLSKVDQISQKLPDVYSYNRRLTKDGKIIITGIIYASATINAGDTVSGEAISIPSSNMGSAINVIVNEEGKIENAIVIKNSNGSSTEFVDTIETKNGEYISFGVYTGEVQISAGDTVNNEAISLPRPTSTGAFLVRYTQDSKVKWMKDVSYISQNYNQISGIEEVNDNVIVSMFCSGVTIPADKTVNNESITISAQQISALWNEEGKIVSLWRLNQVASKIEVRARTITADGGFIVVGTANGSAVTFSAGETSNGEEIVISNGNGAVIKYNSEGKVEWVNDYGTPCNYKYINEVSDGYIALGKPNGGNSTVFKYGLDGNLEGTQEAEELNNIDGIGNISIREKDNGYYILATENNNNIVVNYSKSVSKSVSTIAKRQEELVIINEKIPRKINVEVTKVWDHTNNIYERPNGVKVQLKRGDIVVAEQDMTSIDRVTDVEIPENKDIWKIEFTDLDECDEDGNKIVYTVNEVPSEELGYYQASYDQTTKTIINTYVGPIISQEKEAITEHGKTYVVEGEKITYKIKAKNDGKVAKGVIIKDSIPNGTTFIEDSIKINGVAIPNTQEDLANGITAIVPSNGETILSFEVTVDELQESTYFKQLKNKAVVDGKDTNETITNVNKSNIVFEKTVTPEGNVAPDQELTYNIKVRNTGSLADNVRIDDSIPANTTYIANSIKLNNVSYLDEELTINTEESSLLSDLEGINSDDSVINSEKSITLTKLEEKVTKITAENIQLGENEQAILSFKVKVNDNVENGSKIENIAIVNGKPTVPVENTVIKPIIEVQKEITKIEHTNGQENRLDYVFKGDKITYNITARNTGDLGGYITIKDVISENVILELGSIKINGNSNYVIDGVTTDLSSKTAEDLANGIRVYIPERQGEKAGESILSFNVQVKETARGDVENKAIWLEGEKLDEHETEIVKVPVVVFEKIAEIKRIADEAELPESVVTANDEIEYIINIRNTGTTDSESFIITDDIPENTEIKQILSDGVLTDSKLTWNIDNLQAGESKIVGFIVTVKYNKEKTANIRNTAYVNEVPTNETITQYQKPKPKLETNITKNGDQTAIIGNDINYEISYTGEIKDFVGRANIVIVDQLPYEIDQTKSSLNGGTYSELFKTITWIVPVENIDTYTSGKVNKEITKNLTLYYKTDVKAQEIENTVTATTELIELPEEVVESQEKTATHIVKIREIQELPATGGKGIEIFTNIGLIFIAISMIVIVIRYEKLGRHKKGSK